MIYAPVMITTCNRYEHLKRCLESLQKNTYADETEVYISVDYPPSEEYRSGWEKVCGFLKKPLMGFKEVHIYYQKKNLGPDLNYQYLEELIFRQVDRLIFTEDDNEFSVNFLAYMDKGLELYEKHPTVYGICGYADEFPFESGTDNVIALTNFSAWGMGLWREKEKVIHQRLTRQYWIKQSKKFCLMWRIYSRRSRLFSRMLGTLLENDESDQLPNTDINRGIILACNGYCTINPTVSKVRNWGWDGSGMNIVGSEQGNEGHVRLALDVDADFEYHVHKVKAYRYNDRLLDDNDEWNRDSAKWYHDPLLYLTYFLMGRKRFMKITHRG